MWREATHLITVRSLRPWNLFARSALEPRRCGGKRDYGKIRAAPGASRRGGAAAVGSPPRSAGGSPHQLTCSPLDHHLRGRGHRHHRSVGTSPRRGKLDRRGRCLDRGSHPRSHSSSRRRPQLAVIVRVPSRRQPPPDPPHRPANGGRPWFSSPYRARRRARRGASGSDRTTTAWAPSFDVSLRDLEHSHRRSPPRLSVVLSS